MHTMNEPKPDDLTVMAAAAFRQAAIDVIRTAKRAGTPLIIWEDGNIREIPPELLDENDPKTWHSKSDPE